jgi:uncharacterized Zn finger protein
VTDLTRFDVDTLRQLAGAKTFERGEEYLEDDLVELLAVEPGRVLARVAGSEDYRVELRGRGKTIEGHCSCPAFVEWGFCKHMVAVGLAADAVGETEVEGGGVLSRIREHLKKKSVATLAEMILQLAERDTNLLRKLELAATALDGDDAALEARLRKVIDGATRTGGYVDYESAPEWAAGVDEMLDTIETLVSNSRAALGLKLVERAIDRIEQALGSIDDSDCDCGALLDRADEIHLAAVTVVQPDPVRLARDLFKREMDDGYYVFCGAAAQYEKVLGEPGLAEYRQLAERAWLKLPSRPPSRADQDWSAKYGQLTSILDFFAERDGNTDARIALRAKDLSSSYDYLQLAEFCLKHGRTEDALKYAEEGLWVFEDGRQDQRLVVFTSELLTKVGRNGDAESHLWRAFERAPTLDLYKRLRKLGGEAAHQRALQSLEVLCTRKALTGWHNPANLLVEIQLQEKAFDKAWASFRKFGGSIPTKEQLVRATETTHSADAIEFYTASVEHLATRGSNEGYAEAAKLIARMAKLRPAAEQNAYVISLKVCHGRKRNFMKLLG